MSQKVLLLYRLGVVFLRHSSVGIDVYCYGVGFSSKNSDVGRVITFPPICT